MLRGEPPSIELDAASFETGILPLHFVMCHRVLAKALERAGRTRQQIRYLVYPNTSELDRQSIVRALGIPEDRLSGPGPKDLGHVFASDLLINWPEATHTLGEEECVVALSVGSGFTWGASVFGR